MSDIFFVEKKIGTYATISVDTRRESSQVSTFLQVDFLYTKALLILPQPQGVSLGYGGIGRDDA